MGVQPDRLLWPLLFAALAAGAPAEPLDITAELLRQGLCPGCEVEVEPVEEESAWIPPPPPTRAPPRPLESSESVPTNVIMMGGKKEKCDKPQPRSFSASARAPADVMPPPPKMPTRPPSQEVKNAYDLARMVVGEPEFEFCEEDEYLRDLFERALKELCDGREDSFWGQLDIALEQLREICGGDHPTVGRKLTELGERLEQAQLHDPAERYLRQALATAEAGFGPGHDRTIQAMGRLVSHFGTRERPEEALEVREEAAQRYADLPGVDPSYLATLELDVARGRARHGAPAHETFFATQHAVDRLAEAIGAEVPGVALIRAELAMEYGAAFPRPEEDTWFQDHDVTRLRTRSEAVLRESLDVFERSFGLGHVKSEGLLWVLTDRLVEAGRVDDARAMVEERLPQVEEMVRETEGYESLLVVYLHRLTRLLPPDDRSRAEEVATRLAALKEGGRYPPQFFQVREHWQKQLFPALANRPAERPRKRTAKGVREDHEAAMERWRKKRELENILETPTARSWRPR